MLPTEVAAILNAKPDQTVFELGACNGYHTALLASHCSGNYRLFTFEPDHRNHPQVATVAAQNSRITFIRAAVGNVTGGVPFYLAHPDPGNAIGSSSISPFKDQTKAFPWCTVDGQITVESWRLDDFCRSLALRVEHIDFIWMDVQGAERLVFEGAQEILKHTHYIFTEFEGTRKDNEGTCYEHSSSLERLMEMLPDWQVVKIYEWDALLVNTKFTEPVPATSG